ncbi:hypothetical protein Acor_46680 [Acrocarpospora corrugata]|uniref:Uncharacterized protein n=1 Tax=Acrocarpospora corrugata TaxID=35763 RepID=A0A5M3W3J3_9ACTN|nr:hypothetical protein Acor_46680 [Acrocarpospora corrugata]
MAPWQLVGAGAIGSAAGAVIADEVSGFVSFGMDGATPVGVFVGAVAGVALGASAKRLEIGTRRGESAGHPASAATKTAAGLLVAGAVQAVVMWDGARRAAKELDEILVLLAAPAVLLLCAALGILAVGLVRRRAAARWTAATLGVSGAVASTFWLVAEVFPPNQNPGWLEPVAYAAAAAVLTIALTACLLSPGAAKDFADSRS